MNVCAHRSAAPARAGGGAAAATVTGLFGFFPSRVSESVGPCAPSSCRRRQPAAPRRRDAITAIRGGVAPRVSPRAGAAAADGRCFAAAAAAASVSGRGADATPHGLLHVRTRRGRRGTSVTTRAAAAAAAAAGAAAADESKQPAVVAGGSGGDGVPTFSELVKFTIPFMAVWIASPILSLIDTSIVGLGSTLELAALSPACSVCNNMCHLLGFLGVATTGLVARAMARGDVPEAKAALDQALRVALATGAVVGAAFVVFAVPMLAAFAGPACTELVEPAVAYTRIRAIGFPLALAMNVGQAASLACKDPRPPVLATIVAAVANLAGDLLLCVYPLKLGIAGAAWATVAAQAGATATVLWQLRKPSANGLRPALLDELPIRLPTAEVWWRFVTLGGPVAIVISLKVAYFTLVTRAATAISPVSAAAHGVMLGIFVVLGILGDAVSQVAQAFLPGVLGRPTAALASAKRLLQLGAAVGAVNCVVAAVVATRAGSLFTTSAEVIAAMESIVPVACATLVLHNMSMASEGMMLASRELPYLLVTYAIGATLAVATLAMAVMLGWGLPGVWLAVLQFQVTRLGQNGLRLFFSRKSPLRATGPPGAEQAPSSSGAGGKESSSNGTRKGKGDELELTDITF